VNHRALTLLDACKTHDRARFRQVALSPRDPRAKDAHGVLPRTRSGRGSGAISRLMTPGKY